MALVTTPTAVIEREDLDELFLSLRAHGYRVLGPTVRSGTIVHRELKTSHDLPKGWHDEQAPGTYRIRDDGDDELFGWAVGPNSLKSAVFPADTVVWRGRRRQGDVEISVPDDGEGREAFVGVRPCEVAALAVLSKVLSGGHYRDPEHDRRRQGLAVIVVECGHPASTCFCPSMDTGPDAKGGYDLALTELLVPAHHFLARAGSELGRSLLEQVPHRDATPEDLALEGRRALALTRRDHAHA